VEEDRPAIVIAASGIGNQVYPALAVAKKMKERGYDVYWLGTSKGKEITLAHNAKIPFQETELDDELINSHEKEVLDYLKIPFMFIQSAIKTIMWMREIDPMCVIAMGGWVNAPAVLGSFVCRAPMVLHDQNSEPGRRTQLYSRISDRTLMGFPSKLAKKLHYSVVGNPLPEAFSDIPPPEQRYAEREGPLRVLVLGGKQGDNRLNEFFPQALTRAQKETEMMCVWHQCGLDKTTATKMYYAAMGVDCLLNSEQPPEEPNILLTDYIEDIAFAYSWADLVICKASPLTISEISAVGVATVFVPDFLSEDEEGASNAQVLVRVSGAKIYDKEEMKPEVLCKFLVPFLKRTFLVKMAIQARTIAKPNADTTIADKIESLIEPEDRPS